MKILIAPNAFKGCMSAREFCSCASFLSARHEVKNMPFSDGGDSVLEVFESSVKGAKLYYATALNSIGVKKKVPFIILNDKRTCVIESAKVCGLGELKKSELDIMNASSFGIGQVIKAAYKKGARIFYIGLGGVAFNDAGTGMARALGYKFYDPNNKFLKPRVDALLKLALIKRPLVMLDIKVYGLSDVNNPLLGPYGSAKVYGPQKGASPKQVLIIEAALSNLNLCVKRDLGVNINTKHCGAAGALGAGLKGFLGAKLVSGAPFIGAKLGLVRAIKKADIVITGEGKLDLQTFYGKGPLYICALAARYKKPVYYICGINEVKDIKLLKEYSIKNVFEILKLAGGVKPAMKRAGFFVKKILCDNFYN